MRIQLPELSLVVLIGASGSGKSTFAAKHFRPTEILSSDFFRGLVADDPNDQGATKDAFDALHFIARKRLAAGRLAVIDATNVQPDARRPLIELAREFHVIPVAIILNLPTRVCEARNQSRPERDFGRHVVRGQVAQLRRSLRGLAREGFRHVHAFESAEDVEAASVERVPLWVDRKDDHGPFDLIGDVHGCFEELVELLDRLGYERTGDGAIPGHPDGRKVVFLGDLVDRGPATPAVLRLAMAMVEAGRALWVPGNHDVKLMRKLRGRDVRITHGLAESLRQLEAEPKEFRTRVADFIDKLVSHFVLDDGRLVVAHAGLREPLQGRASQKVREFALYGETTGETDEFGLPVRYDWAAEYRGRALVVYGHTPAPEAEWLNGTICIDTGCVFGGRLTALRYPEKEIVQVEARRTYYEPARPLRPEGAPAPPPAARPYDDLLDIEDVSGKRIIGTRLLGNVTIRAENATAALEVMSRFAVDPRWLIYLPPTMSPSETAREGELLERPAEAFTHYRQAGVPRVVCEEKHMGSRAVLVVCRDDAVACRRFGADDGRSGVVYTRTGRSFFGDPEMEAEVLHRVREAADRSALWTELSTDWLCLDAELLPWSTNAQELLRGQDAPVSAAGAASITEACEALPVAEARGVAATEALARYDERRRCLEEYGRAYRRYCWDVEGVSDLRLAPFHLLASEGRVHDDRDHSWHLEMLSRLGAVDAGLFLPTASHVVDVTDPSSEETGARWWEAITGRGAEGMVVKPLDFLVRSRGRLVQPALKCRGREYLRIIYGPEYTLPENLERLRERSLGAKRALALREFALGLEALHRFVEKEPLYRVHECVFGVLALESEPVDPRL